jgi:hypothetical protein
LANDNTRQSNLAGLGNRLAENSVNIPSGVAIWCEIIAAGVVDGSIESTATNFSMFMTEELSTFTLSKSSSLSST